MSESTSVLDAVCDSSCVTRANSPVGQQQWEDAADDVNEQKWADATDDANEEEEEEDTPKKPNYMCAFHFKSDSGCFKGERCKFAHEETPDGYKDELKRCPTRGCHNMCLGKQCKPCHRRMFAQRRRREYYEQQYYQHGRYDRYDPYRHVAPTYGPPPRFY